MCERSRGKHVYDIGTEKHVHYVQSQAGSKWIQTRDRKTFQMGEEGENMGNECVG